MGPFLCKGEEGGGGARVHHMSPNRSPILDATAFPSFCCLSLSPLYLSPDNARRASGHFSLAASAASLVALSTIDFGRRRRLRGERASALTFPPRRPRPPRPCRCPPSARAEVAGTATSSRRPSRARGAAAAARHAHACMPRCV